MFEKLARYFGLQAANSPQGQEILPRAAQAFESAMTEALDQGHVDSDDVIDALYTIGDNIREVDLMVKARMMGVLSRDIDRLDALGDHLKPQAREYRQNLIKAGQHIATNSHIPDRIVMNFHNVADQLVSDIEMQNRKSGNTDRIDPKTPLGGKDLMDILHFFNTEIARRFDVLKGFETRMVNDPSSRQLGSAGFDNEHERHELQANVRYVKTVRDLPMVAATSLHEGVHMVITDSLLRFKGREEKYRQTDPDFYLLMRLCDRHFYTSKGETYRNLPEEVLAERVGIRFAMRLNDTLNCRHGRDKFETIVASTIAHPLVFAEIDSALENPGPVNLPPRPVAPGVLNQIRHVANVLKANF